MGCNDWASEGSMSSDARTKRTKFQHLIKVGDKWSTRSSTLVCQSIWGKLYVLLRLWLEIFAIYLLSYLIRLRVSDMEDEVGMSCMIYVWSQFYLKATCVSMREKEISIHLVFRYKTVPKQV